MLADPSVPKGPSDRRILAVEDDPDLLRLIRRELEGAGFTVWACPSAEEALDTIARRGLPHLALVDILLPGIDGLALARRLQEWSDLPIVMLTSVDEEETVVQAIERFAEDYIRKPFKPREMVARVERVFRRIGDFAYALQPVMRVDGSLSIDFAHQRAVIDGREVALTSTETKLLYVLLRHAGRVVATDFLLRRLWPSDEVFEDSLRVHVHRLRAKIEPEPSRPRYVVTERGTGYRFPAVSSMNRRVFGLLTRVALALGAVGLLPLAISWFGLVGVNRDALFDQVLNTHALAARTAADRVEAFLDTRLVAGPRHGGQPGARRSPLAGGPGAPRRQPAGVGRPRHPGGGGGQRRGGGSGAGAAQGGAPGGRGGAAARRLPDRCVRSRVDAVPGAGRR